MSSDPSGNSSPSPPYVDPKILRQKLSLLAWIRAGMGALAGFLTGFLGFVSLSVSPTNPNAGPNINAYYGLYIAVLVYLLSYYFAKYRILNGISVKEKNKLITQGIGSYIMLFLFVWILYNTFVYLFGIPTLLHI